MNMLEILNYSSPEINCVIRQNLLGFSTMYPR